MSRLYLLDQTRTRRIITLALIDPVLIDTCKLTSAKDRKSLRRRSPTMTTAQNYTMMFARAASRLATRSRAGVRMASTVAVRTGAPKMTALAAGLALAGVSVSALTIQRTACDDAPLPVYGAPGTNFER